jgi:uncharacterized protein (TIGR04255 family)
MSLPEKLKHDAIIEALLEIRFEPDGAMAPEVVVGLLASCAAWKGFTQNRLPLADIPPPVRQMEPNFRYQPIIELVNSDKSAAAKVGERVVSLHVYKPYCGWDVFSGRLNELSEHLFGTIPNSKVTRLGLRYLNAFLPAVHGISSISELELNVCAAGKPIKEPFNLNYLVHVDSRTECMIRVASRDFVQGEIPQEAGGFVDVDVFTPTGFESSAKSEIVTWLDLAHTREKTAFFSLLSEAQIERMNS